MSLNVLIPFALFSDEILEYARLLKPSTESETDAVCVVSAGAVIGVEDKHVPTTESETDAACGVSVGAMAGIKYRRFERLAWL
jgi:hypothetical protein